MKEIDNIDNAGSTAQMTATTPQVTETLPPGKGFLPPVWDRFLLHSEFLTLSVGILLPFCLLFFAVFLFQVEALFPWVFPVSVATCVAVPAIPAFRFGLRAAPFGFAPQPDCNDRVGVPAPGRRTPSESRSPAPSIFSAFRWLRDPLAIPPALISGPLYGIAYELAAGRGQAPQTDAGFWRGLLPALAAWLVVTALYATAGIAVGERMALRNGKRRRP